MKLQKLCYYAQAWSLVWDEKPIFEEDFQAWANGPVCPKLFNKHRGIFILSDGELGEYDANVFIPDELETLAAIQDFYGDKSPNWLSDLTHQEKPWIDARKDCIQGEICTNEITKTSMQEYYSALRV